MFDAVQNMIAARIIFEKYEEPGATQRQNVHGAAHINVKEFTRVGDMRSKALLREWLLVILSMGVANTNALRSRGIDKGVKPRTTSLPLI